MNRIVFWDLETTGLNPYYHKIIEIAAMDNFGNKFQTLIGGHIVPPEVTKITGITNEMLKGQQSINDALKEFLEFIGNDTKWMIGHNSVKFDLYFLKSAFKRAGIATSLNVKHLDTLSMAQIKHPRANSFSLKNLCLYFKIDQKQAHRAMSDVISTSELFNHLGGPEADLDRIYEILEN